MRLSTMRFCIKFVFLIYFLSAKDAAAEALAYFQSPLEPGAPESEPVVLLKRIDKPLRSLATNPATPKVISQQKTPVAISTKSDTKDDISSGKKHPVVVNAVIPDKNRRTIVKHHDEQNLDHRADDANSRTARNAVIIPLGLIKLYDSNRKRRCLKCGHHTHPPRTHGEESDHQYGLIIPTDQNHQHEHHAGHHHHHGNAPHAGHERGKRHVGHGDQHHISRDDSHEQHADGHHSHHQGMHAHKRSVHYVPSVPVDVINPPESTPRVTESSYIKPDPDYGEVHIINPPESTPRVTESSYIKPDPDYGEVHVINPPRSTPRVIESSYVKPRSYQPYVYKRSVRRASSMEPEHISRKDSNAPYRFRWIKQ